MVRAVRAHSQPARSVHMHMCGRAYRVVNACTQCVWSCVQSCFVATQRALPPLPLPAEAGLVAGRELAKELLQRGVIFTFTAAWLTDRLYEAGADDALPLPAWVSSCRLLLPFLEKGGVVQCGSS